MSPSQKALGGAYKAKEMLEHDRRERGERGAQRQGAAMRGPSVGPGVGRTCFDDEQSAEHKTHRQRLQPVAREPVHRAHGAKRRNQHATRVADSGDVAAAVDGNTRDLKRAKEIDLDHVARARSQVKELRPGGAEHGLCAVDGDAEDRSLGALAENGADSPALCCVEIDDAEGP
eukprot:Amastigsp_a842021_47.p4 type:complete len:174 gc:universal Amastigsp_a842021_47:774-1295(+)